ncbi:hypothetical protein HMPREF0580_0214 [Mobiluncus mulieris ATCC 35239]|uniref:Uncharacterized protein n=2 Tax=Mobiluncus mulieris TaxID=2052 RepID=E0QMV0_9ACTO|nr:hypothetical protein HMPREF0580_0214 [Mobiluncus mulieris ATCC 35239]
MGYTPLGHTQDISETVFVLVFLPEQRKETTMNTLTAAAPSAAELTPQDTRCLAPSWAQTVEAALDRQGRVTPCGAVAEYPGFEITALWNGDTEDYDRPSICMYGTVITDLCKARLVAQELAAVVDRLDLGVFADYVPRSITWVRR